MSHALYELDVNDWGKWASANDVAPVIIAFARFRSELFLNGFDPKQDVNLTPRSLEKMSNILKVNPPREIERDLICGTIGERHAAELSGFIRLWRKLPSLDSILTNPSVIDVPTDPATLFAVAGGLARKATGRNFSQVYAYAKRMPREWQTYLVTDAIARDESVYNKLTKSDPVAADKYDRVVNTSSYIQWATENAELVS
jgi:hypothetical protein